MSNNKTEIHGGHGLNLTPLKNHIRSVYLADDRPWVIGYSGGKDSTCALQLIWRAIRELPTENRDKPIFVLSSDTLVETPIIVDYIDSTLSAINAAAVTQEMPFLRKRLYPRFRTAFG